MDSLNEKILNHKTKLDKKSSLTISLEKLAHECSGINEELKILSAEIEGMQKKLQYMERPEIAFFRRRFTKSSNADQESLKEQYYQCVKTFNTKTILLKEYAEMCGGLKDEINDLSSIEEEMTSLLLEKQKEIIQTNNKYSVQISEWEEMSRSFQHRIKGLHEEKLQLFKLLNPVSQVKSLLTDIIDKGRIEFSGAGSTNSSKKIAAIERLQILVAELFDELQNADRVVHDKGLSKSSIKSYAMSIQNFSKFLETNDVFDMAVRRKLADCYDSTIHALHEIQSLKQYLEDEIAGHQKQLNLQQDQTLKYILDCVLEQENIKQ